MYFHKTSVSLKYDTYFYMIRSTIGFCLQQQRINIIFRHEEKKLTEKDNLVLSLIFNGLEIHRLAQKTELPILSYPTEILAIIYYVTNAMTSMLLAPFDLLLGHKAFLGIVFYQYH